MVFPSIYPNEAFGILQLESMVYQKPVINTNLPTGVPWVSVDNESGLTVDVNNSNQLAQAIRELYRNKKLVETFGKGAIKRIDTLFTTHITTKQIYDLYFGD
jgi:rhamnosyl/mannosyltransferase